MTTYFISDDTYLVGKKILRLFPVIRFYYLMVDFIGSPLLGNVMSRGKGFIDNELVENKTDQNSQVNLRII